MALNFDPTKNKKMSGIVPLKKGKKEFNHYKIFEEPKEDTYSTIQKSNQINTLGEESNQTQLNTTEHSINYTQQDTTEHNSNKSTYKEISTLNDLTNLSEHNQTQLNTALTTHNKTQPNTTEQIIQKNTLFQQDTTEHNYAQPNTTEHNCTPQGTQPNTKTAHNQTQQLNTTEHIISKLSGAKSQVLSFLCNKSLLSDCDTLTMTYGMLSTFSGVKMGSIKTTCIRLKSMNLIGIHSSGGGRNQMTGFEIYPETKNAFSRIKLTNKVTIFNIHTEHNRIQQPNTTTEHNQTQLHTTRNTNVSRKVDSSFKSNYLSNSGEIEKNETEHPDEDLLSVNISALSSFGIFKKQISDIKNQKLKFTIESLQDFIDRFVIFASEPNNLRKVKSVPGLFVKMAQEASKGNDPLSDIETDDDRFIRERLELLKRKKEDRLKRRSELFELEFENWINETNFQKQLELVPEVPFAKQGSSGYQALLRGYFQDNIWPEVSEGFERL